eukprot:TRINITY_DN2209_c1_g1_i1.p1 TRINITY_DN2209_c1_g1~~TRINITY_DN2209_c1_g1_i1.p1  ORF type:complete len:202 (+),score=62.54 TRINITY_DN2209_c1_g1_i1:127-732(+)
MTDNSNSNSNSNSTTLTLNSNININSSTSTNSSITSHPHSHSYSHSHSHSHQLHEFKPFATIHTPKEPIEPAKFDQILTKWGPSIKKIGYTTTGFTILNLLVRQLHKIYNFNNSWSFRATETLHSFLSTTSALKLIFAKGETLPIYIDHAEFNVSYFLYDVFLEFIRSDTDSADTIHHVLTLYAYFGLLRLYLNSKTSSGI